MGRVLLGFAVFILIQFMIEEGGGASCYYRAPEGLSHVGSRSCSPTSPHPLRYTYCGFTIMAITSGIFSAICLVTLATVVLLLQRFFLPLRSTPEYLLVSTFLPLFISSSIVVLVPIDLASSSAGDSSSRGIHLPPLFWSKGNRLLRCL